MRSVNGVHLARLLGNWTAKDRAGPTYAQLAAAVRLLVLDGRLALATRLPSERELADALGLSRTTVTTAYDGLRGSGYASSRPGSGTWTALPTSHRPSDPPWAPAAPVGSELIDLAHASVAAPTQALREAYDAALEELPRFLPGHGYGLYGLSALRAVLADRYAARGLPTAADQILVTAGAQHAWSLVLGLAVTAGDRVLVEHPTYPNALDASRRAGARLVPVALTDDGWDVEAMSAAFRQTAPRLAYLVPDFHNPTGLLASEEVRTRLAQEIRRTRTLTVVDEALVELALDDRPVPRPFAANLRDDLVVTIGSVSKTVWGGLRVGWLRSDPATVQRLAAVRATVDISSPVLDQLAVAHVLRAPDNVLTARRRELRESRDALVAALGQRLPEWTLRVPDGGLVLWCDLGAPLSSALVGAGERQGLRLAAGPRFGVDGAFERRLRLPYTYTPDVLADAVERLAASYRSVTDGVELEQHTRVDAFA
ncbi:MAG: PLP-dependent aminotransferase family protein [Jiangellaceae bacterium]